MIKKTAIVIILILLVGVVILYSYTSNKETSSNTEASSNTITPQILENIYSDKIYQGLSEDFSITISKSEGNKILAKLIMNSKFQEKAGENINTGFFRNYVGGLATGYMALLIDEHISEYDSIEISLYDNNNNQIYRKIVVKEEVKNLKDAGYTRENFDSMMNS